MLLRPLTPVKEQFAEDPAIQSERKRKKEGVSVQSQ
jgi:hypothetical protein